MKLKIDSDGTVGGTQVLTQDGERIEGITHIRWEITAVHGKSRATIELREVPVQVLGDTVTIGKD